jgi:hypothetical protein
MSPDAVIILLVFLITALTSTITIILLYCYPQEIRLIALPKDSPPSYAESTGMNIVMV